MGRSSRQAKAPAPPQQRSGAGGFACPPILLGTLLFAAAAAAQSDAVAVRDAKFNSEGVWCAGKVYLPGGLAADQKIPGVVLAPAWGETSASIEPYARSLAKAGVAAMTIDYRGWGKSGGYIYLAEQLRYDDRLRFSQHTAKVRIRRKRLIPQDQVLDIRNAISYLQGEPNVDRARIGVWGADMAGGHAVVVAATDARVKAIVAQTPRIEGLEKSRKAEKPTAQTQADEVKLARSGDAPSSPAAAAAMTVVETRLALAEYHAYWYIDQIPKSTKVMYLVVNQEMRVESTDSLPLSAEPKRRIEGPLRESAAKTAADWFAKNL